jgi:hypothetical protein
MKKSLSRKASSGLSQPVIFRMVCSRLSTNRSFSSRIGDRVQDGRRRRDERRLAHALGAEGAGWLGSINGVKSRLLLCKS